MMFKKIDVKKTLVIFIFFALLLTFSASAKAKYTPSIGLNTGVNFTRADNKNYQANYITINTSPLSYSFDKERLSLNIDIRLVDNTNTINNIRLQCFGEYLFGISYMHTWNTLISTELKAAASLGMLLMTEHYFSSINFGITNHFFVANNFALSVPIKFQIRNGLYQYYLGFGLSYHFGREV